MYEEAAILSAQVFRLHRDFKDGGKASSLFGVRPGTAKKAILYDDHAPIHIIDCEGVFWHRKKYPLPPPPDSPDLAPCNTPSPPPPPHTYTNKN